MNKPKVIAYLKPTCGWSQGVRAVLNKYQVPYEDRNVKDPVHREEMVRRTGQEMSPCVEIEGHMLPDVSGDEVEAYLLAHSLVEPTDRPLAVPIDQPCADVMP